MAQQGLFNAFSLFPPPVVHIGDCGSVDRLPWQRCNGNHFPPDVRMGVRRRRETRRKNICRRHHFHLCSWTYLPLPLRSITPPFQSRTPPPPPPPSYVSQFYTSRLSLHPRRQLGQPVFTAGVIGVVRREPDPGPTKAPDKCVPAFILCVCVRTRAHVLVMTGSKAKEGKQSLSSVSPLGNRQIGFHRAVCLFSSLILQQFLSSSHISLHLCTSQKTIIHTFSSSCSVALFLLAVFFWCAHHFICLRGAGS